MRNRIKELRLERGINRFEMANDVGISYMKIRRYELGESEPKLETWIKLANYFDVPVGYLQGIEAHFELTNGDEWQTRYDAICKSEVENLRAASVGKINWEEAYQNLKRYQRKRDELRFGEIQETERRSQQRMFDLALSTFRRDHNEKR